MLQHNPGYEHENRQVIQHLAGNQGSGASGLIRHSFVPCWDSEDVGYEVHITRKKSYADEDGPQITWDEWEAYVATDPELRLAPELGKRTVIMNIKCAYTDPWLHWYEGSIDTKNPDEAILGKMLQIASMLKAKVQGDDGEVYRSANFKDHYDED